jgi:AmmeMemoRadiSam system protein B/AmmeMemoRadiSam system protein A
MTVSVSSLLAGDQAMKPLGRSILVLAMLMGLSGCGDRPQASADNPDSWQTQGRGFEKVRGMAVAGLFYPRHKDDLTKAVDGYLKDAKPEAIENVRGLVCPHAGYEYSGATAAFGYKLLAGRDIRTVVVMGPSHYATFQGASIPDVDAYETPLGMIPLSPKAAELAKLAPFVVNPRCKVVRPDRGQWLKAPKELPPFGEDTPHTWEHSLEVQLPFLQRTLKDFSIVPVVFGNPSTPQEAPVDAEQVANVLLKHLDDKTLLVASSDLSHFHTYEAARGLDTTCCKAICSLNTEWMERQEACGKGPLLALMHVARKMGWKAKLLDYRNTGDVTGERSRGVVGYAAVAFYDSRGAADTRPTSGWCPPPERIEQGKPTTQQQAFLLKLARRTLDEVVSHRRLPQVDSAEVPQGLTESRACFVTLNKDGRLRGCVGDIFPRRPLYQAVVYSAAGAAVVDQRFLPVGADELAQIEIEISLLSLPASLEFKSPQELLEKLRPGVDGVVLRVGQQQATYLPQVWQQIPDKEEFLRHLAEKAGLEGSAWRDPKARILVYQAEAFHEKSEK